MFDDNNSNNSRKGNSAPQRSKKGKLTSNEAVSEVETHDGISQETDMKLILQRRFSTRAANPHSVAEDAKRGTWGFPGGAVVENLPANAGDTGSSPGLGRSHMPRSN